MTIRTVCPSCRKVYNLDESMQGKTVRCRECQSPFAVPASSRQGRRDDGSRPADERITMSSRPANTAGQISRDDDKPQRRPAERRSPRKDKDSSSSKKNLLPILLGAGAAVVVLGGLVIGGVAFVLRGTDKSSTPATAVANQPALVPAVGKADAASGLAARPVAGPPADLSQGAGAAVPAAEPPKKVETAVPAGPVPSEMAADVVQKVKQSTAYLRVTLASGEVAQGSGFFALERDLVITNAHVVGMLRSSSPPRRVEVVIHSGEDNEKKLAATVLGLDRANDLAVLRVQGDLSRLPPPLPLASATELVETQKVYIFGFPFGAQLGKNITVSTSSISALRRGDDGILKEVQVNGGMNPGNSGGPVTDARGVVIGVSVAVISGTQINFAIPADFIRPLVERSKNNPLDLTSPPGPFTRNDPPTRPAPSSSLEQDLAALKGTWESGTVGADGGGATATVKISISPQPGSQGGRIRLEIATKQGGGKTSSASNYAFTLEQKGNERFLVTAIRRGPRGTVRGMVFLYRFEGDRLILSGVIASTRLTYKLDNVPLQRISTEPDQAVADKPAPANPDNPAPAPPAAGGSGNASAAAALKIDGDVYAFVGEAVQAKRLADVDIRGFTLNRQTYRDVCDKGILIGFQVGFGKFVNNDIVKSFRPIYQTKNGAKFGKWIGPVPPAPIVTVKAKPGYVVSGLSVRTALSINAITITFAKLGKDGLDMSDTYESKPIGGTGGRPAMIGGNGQLFVGVTGHLDNDGAPSSLGLVAVLPKDD
jgi:S1-C subfamily serine protease